jgi:hypothetical protein
VKGDGYGKEVDSGTFGSSHGSLRIKERRFNMGLVIIGALALYLLLSIAVVIGAIKFAKQNGKSAKRWGWSAALVMYLIPFWDWIPTVAVHQYYCSTEAGFWVYKTPEQWVKENPRVIETLALASADKELQYLNHKKVYFESITDRRRLPLIPITLYSDEIVDVASRELLAKHVGVGSGYGYISTSNDWRSIKFWLNLDPCDGQALPSRGEFEAILVQYRKLGGK